MENTIMLKYEEIGNVFTIKEFLQDSMLGCLKDTDGRGVLSFGRWISGVEVYPSTIAQELIFCKQTDNLDFTHVVWYNK